MQKRLELLLVLIPMLASVALVVADSLEQARSQPAPKTLETPHSKSEERDDTQSQAPQHAPGEGEVIGVPMLA